MCTVSSAISRSIYQNVSPLIRVSGYLPILLDNFQERGKRWCFVGRRREVASKSKKWMESTRKRRKSFRDYLISIYSKFKKLIKVSIIYSAHKSHVSSLGNKASTFLLQVRFLSSYCAKGSGTFLLLALLLLVPRVARHGRFCSNLGSIFLHLFFDAAESLAQSLFSTDK